MANWLAASVAAVMGINKKTLSWASPARGSKPIRQFDQTALF
jgi:hypothetical protein